MHVHLWVYMQVNLPSPNKIHLKPGRKTALWHVRVMSNKQHLQIIFYYCHTGLPLWYTFILDYHVYHVLKACFQLCHLQNSNWHLTIILRVKANGARKAAADNELMFAAFKWNNCFVTYTNPGTWGNVVDLPNEAFLLKRAGFAIVLS